MKQHVVKNSKDMAKLLGLSEADAVEAELKTQMMIKIRDVVKNKGWTHQEVADLTGAGRTVVTGIINSSIQSISLNRLIKILVDLGIEPQLSFKKSS